VKALGCEAAKCERIDRERRSSGQFAPTVLDFPAAALSSYASRTRYRSRSLRGVETLHRGLAQLTGSHYQSQFDLPFCRDAQRRKSFGLKEIPSRSSPLGRFYV